MIFIMLILAILSLLSALIVLHWLYKPSGSPPGSRGLPIIGAVGFEGKLYKEFITDCRKKYGDVFWLKFGSQQRIYVCGYELIKEAFNNPHLHGKQPTFFSSNPFRDRGLLYSSNEIWKESRRFTLRHLRDAGMSRNDAMEESILFEASILVEEFAKQADKPTEIPWSINVAVFNVIWKLVGEERHDISSKYIHGLHSLLHDAINLIQKRGFYLNCFPWSIKILPTFILKQFFNLDRYVKYQTDIIGLMKEVVENNKEKRNNNDPRNMIDHFFASSKFFNDKERFSENDLLAILIDLFVTGSDTTSTTMRWYILLMAKYPNIQKKVHDEFDRTLGMDQLPTFSDKDKLTYFEATIYETLRYKPFLPYGLAHKADQDTHVGGYLVKKGTIVCPHIEGSHFDTKYFAKPNEFYPEHFLNEDGSLNSKKEGFLPFSIGKRMCMGEALARKILYIFMGTLMQNFTFRAVSGEELEISPHPDEILFNIPQPYRVIVSKR